MTQMRLSEFSETKSKNSRNGPVRELMIRNIISETRKLPFIPPVASDEMAPAYFISAMYNGQSKKVAIKLYEPISGQIYFWYDNTRHSPYCLTNLSPIELSRIDRLTNHPGFDHFEIVEKNDPLLDRTIKVTKIIAKDPLAIGGRPKGCIRDIIPEEFEKTSETLVSSQKTKIWESKIRYYQSYIYDRKLWPGMIYTVKNRSLILKRNDKAEENILNILTLFKNTSPEEQQYTRRWATLLEYPAPGFHRVAIDIEVHSSVPNRIPSPHEASDPVICVSFYGSNEQKVVLLLKRHNIQQEVEQLQSDIDLKYFNSEKQLIKAVFNVLWTYPFVITFNGDDFDLLYLANRAEKLGFSQKDIPINVRRRVCLLNYGTHIDLYRFFFNPSIQIYAFNNRYRDKTLNEIGKSLIGIGKVELNSNISELTYKRLAKYCLRDAEITFKLTSFEDELVMKLVLILSRISSMPVEDVSRQGVSRWIRNFMQREHRRRGILIPNTSDILAEKGETATEAIIKGKKYKGAIVVEPVPGVHFNVAVMDFPSLYPSIIKVWNLGYKSVRCQHPECQKNIIPDTPHWVCTREKALESLLIGSLRDLRVMWYKQKSKDLSLPIELRNWYRVIQGAIKVILNASYGVFGSESFDLYCPPVAEATAAIGRHSITQIINKAKSLNIQVLYGDTDSVFLKNPTKQQIKDLAHWTQQKLKMSLDVEKVYRYAVFSSRKKNYLAVLEDGSVDVKGLTGKKRHIPPFIKKAFDKMKERLAQVQTPGDFEKAKTDIKTIIHSRYLQLKRREWENLNELAFNVVLGQSPEHYKKTTPQHVKAARILQERGRTVKVGDIMSFVKVTGKSSVKPVELAKSNEVDVDKYTAYLRSTFDQVLDALDQDFDEIIGLTKLERFM